MNLRWQIAQFFEKLWWRRYLAHREKAEYLDWKKKYWAGFLEKSGIRPAENAQILDAGCGPAGIFTLFSQKYATDAVDPLLDDYEKTLPHFRRADYPYVRFFCEKLESFDPQKNYDLVFCLNAINHVADLGAGFDKLAQLTRPGGTLAVSVDAHRSPFLKKIFQWLPGDILHPHQHSLAEYQAMLTSRGLKIERTILVKREAIFDYFLIVATN